MLPVLGCDSHFHIFAPASDPSTVSLNATQHGTIDEILHLMDLQGLSHGLAIGALPYGSDNSVLLSGLKRANGRLKGIGVVDPLISDDDWDHLNTAGVIGARINLVSWGLRQLIEPGADQLLARVRESGWFLQVLAHNDELAAAAPTLRRLPGMRLMFDHFGRPDVQAGLDQPGFQELLKFGREGTAVVKLSAPFRSSRTGAPYEDVDPYIEAVLDAFTIDRCVWGSDWPFTNADTAIDYAHQRACLERWIPDPADRYRVMVTNPAQLFGLGEVGADQAGTN